MTSLVHYSCDLNLKLRIVSWVSIVFFYLKLLFLFFTFVTRDRTWFFYLLKVNNRNTFLMLSAKNRQFFQHFWFIQKRISFSYLPLEIVKSLDINCTFTKRLMCVQFRTCIYGEMLPSSIILEICQITVTFRNHLHISFLILKEF